MTQIHESACWSLQANEATFTSADFSASISLLKPGRGVTNISYRGDPTEGLVLGISPSEHKIEGSEEIADAYVRGSDLVVTYAQTEARPFALQIYWRVNLVGERVVQLDGIVSLQTCLLESFPLITARTELPSEITDGMPAGTLLRGGSTAWSYAELVQPEDRGESPDIDSSNRDRVAIHHQLGGQFLEKGVIRRLRLRGLFLPRENDLKLAEKYLASLENEELPLTV